MDNYEHGAAVAESIRHAVAHERLQVALKSVREARRVKRAASPTMQKLWDNALEALEALEGTF